MRYIATLVAIVFLAPLVAHAAAYPGDEDVIGVVRNDTVQAGDSLVELARRYDLGINAVAEANPALDPFVPKTGAPVTVPTGWIVPHATEPGTIVVNLSEMRLYYLYYQDEVSFLVTFPIGIGSEGAETPPGTYRVIEKTVSPDWHVPSSIKKEKPWLPPVVPAGPDNPLGSHALRLSEGSIMIHGTNKPWGVGRRVSHGCIRLYPEDIPRLFRLVSLETPVAVVREPVKVGVRGGRVFVEVHRDDELKIDYIREADRLLEEKWLLEQVDPAKLYSAILEKKGVPVDITELGGTK
ncbi:MAG TPA: L,D-transpeptidase family protein [Geobacteraceae bacterium]